MIKYNLLNYCTEYSAQGTVEHRMRKEVCFSQIFHNNEDKIEHYEIIVYKDKNQLNNNYNNYCLLDINQIDKHIKFLKTLFEIKYEIKDFENKYVIAIDLHGKSLKHKFTLGWVRYLYEYPFNYILAASIKLKRNFKGLTRFDMFNLVASCLQWNDYRDCHTMIPWRNICKFIPHDKLKQIVNEDRSGLFEAFRENYENYYRDNLIVLKPDPNEIGMDWFLDKVLVACKENYKQIKKL